SAVPFPRPMLSHKNYDFSFSGLKTAVLYYLRDKPPHLSIGVAGKQQETGNKLKADVAASFQQAAVDVLLAKTMRAAKEFGVKSVLLCGGVAANKTLRQELKRQATRAGKKFFAPDFSLNTDNAAMIGAAAYIKLLSKKRSRLIAQGNINL
ncbi:MAG: tRNA (adenosine(37)-N6)-threonylcarbamoyltransferase complex transferase subunit TsaD, partial [Parcubacteria group bacterium]|nr:tRNA (adenosine(37)-N6)-threonylcarbamoyltransferase complex transferase subunit TsaD [Parcubacteria group bacterium]